MVNCKRRGWATGHQSLTTCRESPLASKPMYGWRHPTKSKPASLKHSYEGIGPRNGSGELREHTASNSSLASFQHRFGFRALLELCSHKRQPHFEFDMFRHKPEFPPTLPPPPPRRQTHVRRASAASRFLATTCHCFCWFFLPHPVAMSALHLRGEHDSGVQGAQVGRPGAPTQGSGCDHPANLKPGAMGGGGGEGHRRTAPRPAKARHVQFSSSQDTLCHKLGLSQPRRIYLGVMSCSRRPNMWLTRRIHLMRDELSICTVLFSAVCAARQPGQSQV